MWHSMFRMVRTAVILFLSLVGLFVILEIVRAGQTFYALHPIAGWLFTGLIAALGLLLVGRFIWIMMSRPALLNPPNVPEFAAASRHELRQYGRYLRRYADRLATNPVLSAEERQMAVTGGQQLTAALDGADKDSLRTAVESAENQTVRPLLEQLDESARRHVRAAMRDVMIGVTLSPWRAIDLLMVLYRNLTMATAVVATYNHRPRLREQLAIYRDILAVTAAVNFLSMGKNLLEGLCARVPGVGRFLDDIAQGMGAGFLTAVVGHAAIDRCRAVRRWDRRSATSMLGSQAAAFYADVRDTFQKDILPAVLKRIGDSSRETMEKIASALDETGSKITSFVKVPIQAAVAAGNTAINAGQSIGTFSKRHLWDRFRNKF